MVATCKECKLEVESRAALVAHWSEQRDQGNRHYHCSLCMQLFSTPEGEDRHHREFHPAPQDLPCPGCNERFVSVAGLMEHIEKNRCKRIGNDDYVAHREERLAFSRELQRRHHGEAPDTPAKNDFTQFLSKTKSGAFGTSSISALRPKAEDTVRPNPVTFAMKKVEFPQLASKQPAPLTGAASASASASSTQRQAGNPWAQKKKLFPDAPAAVRPAPQQPQALEAPAQKAEQEWAPHDPKNPKWNPKDYFVKYTNKYKCPHDRCPKSFPTGAGLRTHLLSARHSGLAKMQCPRCCRWFDTASALTAHAVAPGAKCEIRKTNNYRQFLDQLTAGIIDTTEKHGDGTAKFSVPDEARERFQTSQGAWIKEQQLME